MVAETGSFIDAARKMNITQSTVCARIKGLEDLLGRPLFERSKNGADAHRRRRSVPEARAGPGARVAARPARGRPLGPASRPPRRRRAMLAVGRISCCNGCRGCATNIPDIAVSAWRGLSAVLTQRLIEGTLDLAVMYRPEPAAGPHHRAPVRRGVRAGDERAGAAAGAAPTTTCSSTGARISSTITPPPTPSCTNPGLNLDLGSIGLDYLLANEASGYFPRRLVKRHVARGRLRIPSGRASSPIRSTWSIRKRATRRPTSRSSTVAAFGEEIR